jgi:thioredoxin-like negative regulator of GroEL
MTPEEKLTAFRRFASERPGDAPTRYALAMHLSSMERKGEAVEELREVLRIDPGYVPAFQQLGKLLAALGDREEAMKVYESGLAAATGPKNDHARRKLGKWLDALRTGGEKK